MSGYGGSVLNSARSEDLIVGVNWLGDAIMSMPALQWLAQSQPGAPRDLLIKPHLDTLWEMHPDIGRRHHLAPGNKGPFSTGHQLKAAGYQRCFVQPHSFRSAIAPWWAGIPERIGTPGNARSWMLTQKRRIESDTPSPHQAWEILRLMTPEQLPEALPHPTLRIPAEVLDQVHPWLEPYPRPLLGLLPGAARGPSKQWPENHFAAVAREWTAQTGGAVVLMGTPNDQALCNRILGLPGAPVPGINLSGKTSLQELAALLKICDAVLANDSGGMHLAAALETATVGIFGMTDPTRTGPLGPRTHVLQKSEVRSRNIPRDSPLAREALLQITPKEALDALLSFVNDPSR